MTEFARTPGQSDESDPLQPPPQQQRRSLQEHPPFRIKFTNVDQEFCLEMCRCIAPDMRYVVKGILASLLTRVMLPVDELRHGYFGDRLYSIREKLSISSDGSGLVTSSHLFTIDEESDDSITTIELSLSNGATERYDLVVVCREIDSTDPWEWANTMASHAGITSPLSERFASMPSEASQPGLNFLHTEVFPGLIVETRMTQQVSSSDFVEPDRPAHTPDWVPLGLLVNNLQYAYYENFHVALGIDKEKGVFSKYMCRLLDTILSNPSGRIEERALKGNAGDYWSGTILLDRLVEIGDVEGYSDVEDDRDDGGSPLESSGQESSLDLTLRLDLHHNRFGPYALILRPKPESLDGLTLGDTGQLDLTKPVVALLFDTSPDIVLAQQIDTRWACLNKISKQVAGQVFNRAQVQADLTDAVDQPRKSDQDGASIVNLCYGNMIIPMGPTS